MKTKEQPYKWSHIQRYFPKEEVARMRKQLLDERASGKYTDRELMERYRMSKQTFYDTVRRYHNAKEIGDYIDKSKAPKNPPRKLMPEIIARIHQMVKEDRIVLEKGSASL